MLEVTQEAAGLIIHTLAGYAASGSTTSGEALPGDAAVRLVIQDDELTIAIDKEKEGDFVVEADGRAILVIEQGLADAIKHAKFDAEMTEDGPMLTLTPPEAEDGEGAEQSE